MSRRQDLERERLNRRKANGQCVSCTRPSSNGVRCEICAAKHSEYSYAYGNKAYRDRKKAAGLCIRCGGSTPEVPHVICNTCLETAKANSQARRRREKSAAFDHYGRICVCCKQGFDEAFLTLNHVNNDGAEHKRTVGEKSLYRWAKQNKFPSILETNCWNCNCARQVNGGVCPHAVKKNAASV